MGMLELGDSKKEKRAVVIGLSVVHLGAFAGIVTVFAAGLSSGMNLSPMLSVVAVIATTLWLFSFILLSVNVAYYFLTPQEDIPQEVTPDSRVPEGEAELGENSGSKL